MKTNSITHKGKPFYVVTMKDHHNKDVRRVIKDATDPLAIHVKAPDIKGAVCKDHQKCVVANAIKRSLRAPWVDVGASQVIVGKTATKGVRYKLNSLGREIIRFFDENDGRAAPTMIELTPATQSQRIGNTIYMPSTSRKKKNSRRLSTR